MSEITPDIISSVKTKKKYNVGEVVVYDLKKFAELTGIEVEKLPFSIRVLLENVLRNYDGKHIKLEDVKSIANWPEGSGKTSISFKPSRVVLQDFTGVPLIVDLAAMRDAVKDLGGDPEKINPIIPTDLVIDHSIQVDYYGSIKAFPYNLKKDYERNKERYTLIKWAQNSFKNMRVVPPATGIIHQINLEYLARVVDLREKDGENIAVVDSVVGTDSHTTMINGLGVLGWGVGGIEAEAVMLGQAYNMLLPEVIGVRLTGELPEGATATDLVLTIVEMLRKKGVVGKFVEFFGPGLSKLSIPDRATLANMAPEYGATMGFFPIDDATIEYLRLTNRPEEKIEFIKSYAQENLLFRRDNSPEPVYSDVVELDMSTVVPTLAGPLNPDEKVTIDKLKERVTSSISKYHEEKGIKESKFLSTEINIDDEKITIEDGDVAIAAITSCTNTSNPSVLIGAGLLAKKAVEYGLKVPKYVKTSLAPGSRVVTEYLNNLNLMSYLEALGFHVVGYGCTTCIGNSGPLPEPVEKGILEKDLYMTSVLSGNRNFGGRVHQHIRGNFLASPMLVVSYAIAGTTKIDLSKEPLAIDPTGEPIYLKDVWPSQKEIRDAIEKGLSRELFKKQYEHVLEGDEKWQALNAPKTTLYQWDPESTYVRKPPYFEGFDGNPRKIEDIKGARVLVMLGDKVSTDHISPAGAIPKESPAGKYLLEHGVKPHQFNTYGARRGNHEVMMRGTFANVRIKNQLVPGKEGWWTKYIPTNEIMTIFDAAMRYKKENIPVIVLGAKQYGQGSSRDWAGKGPALLGVRAVIAKDFERIHRSNLIGMGVLPLQFKEGEGWKELGLDGTEEYDIIGLSEGLTPRKELKVIAKKQDGTKIEFNVIARIDTEMELEYYRYGGIMQYVIADILGKTKK